MSVGSDAKRPSRSLPSNTVYIASNGRVVRIVQWTIWHGAPCMILEIYRRGRRFVGDIGDPEHGGGCIKGSLLRMTSELNPAVQARIRKLFLMRKATEEKIRAAGFESYEVVFED